MQAYDRWTGRFVDVLDGAWYPWTSVSPPLDARSLECRRNGGRSFALDPSTLYPEYNVAGLEWRDPL